MDNICILEDTAAELEKAKALVTLIQSGTDDYASIDGPFKSGFEMICTNLFHPLRHPVQADGRP